MEYGGRSVNVSNQRPRLAQKIAETPTLLKGFSGVKTRFERILVAARSARPRRAAVHTAAPFPTHGRRAAGSAGTRFRAAARACAHWTGVARMIPWHSVHSRGTRLGAGFGRRSSSGASGRGCGVWDTTGSPCTGNGSRAGLPTQIAACGA